MINDWGIPVEEAEDKYDYGVISMKDFELIRKHDHFNRQTFRTVKSSYVPKKNELLARFPKTEGIHSSGNQKKLRYFINGSWVDKNEAKESFLPNDLPLDQLEAAEKWVNDYDLKALAVLDPLQGEWKEKAIEWLNQNCTKEGDDFILFHGDKELRHPKTGKIVFKYPTSLSANKRVAKGFGAHMGDYGNLVGRANIHTVKVPTDSIFHLPLLWAPYSDILKKYVKEKEVLVNPGTYLSEQILDEPFQEKKGFQPEYKESIDILITEKVIKLQHDDGLEVPIFQNPNYTQIVNLYKKSTDSVLKWIIDKENNLYVWDAYHFHHRGVDELLGLNSHSSGLIENEKEAQEVLDLQKETLADKENMFEKKLAVKTSFVMEPTDDGFEIVAYVKKEIAGNITVAMEYLESDCYAFSPYKGEKFYDDICSNPEVINIQLLEVEDAYTGKGIASELMTRAMKEIKKKYAGMPVYINASPMGDVVGLNDLISFYKKYGFKLLKTYPQYRNALLWKDRP
jgi:GNAT superfamily N-acetyltransferase